MSGLALHFVVDGEVVAMLRVNIEVYVESSIPMLDTSSSISSLGTCSSNEITCNLVGGVYFKDSLYAQGNVFVVLSMYIEKQLEPRQS